MCFKVSWQAEGVVLPRFTGGIVVSSKVARGVGQDMESRAWGQFGAVGCFKDSCLEEDGVVPGVLNSMVASLKVAQIGVHIWIPGDRVHSSALGHALRLVLVDRVLGLILGLCFQCGLREII